MNAQKESVKKTSGVHTSSRKPTKKCAMKMKVYSINKEKKRRARKNVIDGRRVPVEKQYDRLQRTSGR